MTTGEAGPPLGAPQFTGPAYGAPAFGGYGPPHLSDDDLRRLPPPALPPHVPAPPSPAWPAPAWPGSAPAVSVQRPAGVTIAACLTVTASALWVCALTLAWVVSAAASDTLSELGSDGAVFHLLDRFHARMFDGLAVPLYLFPLASLVTGFLIVSRRGWTRVAQTAVGVAALGWSAWWLRDTLLPWACVAAYVALAVGLLWTPGATRWYAASEPARRAG